jgi:hypothetical protein
VGNWPTKLRLRSFSTTSILYFGSENGSSDAEFAGSGASGGPHLRTTD